jgi:nitroimidazol reductase NimA-like FMN-containing flavoprotein (pyridoxamine 5'-phosphate oxidase superfamily)
MNDELKSTRTTLHRMHERGRHDFATIAAILDAGFVCHVGYEVDGQPYVVPTCYGRADRRLYLHGSQLSRTMRELGRGVPVCVTVTHVDGIVVARSGYHSSINYRSAMILGHAEPLPDADREAALRTIVEQIVPGRWPALRPPTRGELDLTAVVRVEIVEASAKVRTGPPGDDEADYALPIWAGVLPLELRAGSPEPDPRLAPGVPVPAHVEDWRRH